jgi:ABC-2 type transport system ATP-binding protein
MGQRLGIASALLADPSVVMLDEPVNGLDPDGILWIRNLLKELAADGRTVFVSSHLMSEMAVTAEHLIVIGRGRVISDSSMSDFISLASTRRVLVASPQASELRDLVAGPGVSVTSSQPGHLEIEGLTATEIGELAAASDLTLHQLYQQEASLEEAFMELTRDSVEFHGSTQTNERSAA